MRKRVKLCKKRKITQIGKKCLSRTTRRYKDVEARAQSRAKKKILIRFFKLMKMKLTQCSCQ